MNTSSPEPGRRRAAGRLGGLEVLQIVCWQLVLVAITLAAGRPWPLVSAVVLSCLVLVALTAVRFRGRWLYQWLVSASKYSLRDRDRDLHGADEAGQALLSLISPEATGSTHNVNGSNVFMLSRADGVTAVLQPKATAHDLTSAMPAPETLLPPPHEHALTTAAQVIHHCGGHQQRAPRAWVALQTLRTVEVYRDADVQRALGNTIRRVQRQLRQGGLPARGLAENEVTAVLASVAHVTGSRSQVREEWRFWRCGPVSQVTFRLDGWATLSPATAPYLLRQLLTALPHAAVTIAVTARRPAATAAPRIDAALRVAAPTAPAVEAAARELARLAREGGVTMERLDGRHSWGMAATLPIGVAGTLQELDQRKPT